MLTSAKIHRGWPYKIIYQWDEDWRLAHLRAELILLPNGNQSPSYSRLHRRFHRSRNSRKNLFLFA